jgi:hypothetical protein
VGKPAALLPFRPSGLTLLKINRRPNIGILPSALITFLATSAAADVTVTFRDGAPKDRFTITNVAACATGPFDLTIDLAGSPSNLIFDITGDGAGVEVFQPCELVSGTDSVFGASDVQDGDNQMTLSLAALPVGGVVAFTIDLDDRHGRHPRNHSQRVRD